MKYASRLCALAGLAVGLSVSASADTIWTLDATFAYNDLTNHATGQFTLDSLLNLLSWNITVDGTNTQANDTYTGPGGDSIPVFPDLTHLDFYDTVTNQYINLYLNAALSNTGGVIDLLHGDPSDFNNAIIVCDGCGTLVQGTVTGAPAGAEVPEPRLGVFLAMSLVGLAAFARRKLAATAN